MLQVPFSFRPLEVLGIIGQATSSQDRLHLYELAPRYSNRFILGYVPRLENAQVWFKKHNIVIADAKGVIRDNIIHDFIPDPELSGVDFQNMLNALKQSYKLQSTDKAYICYAVDLVNSIIYFEAFEAVDLNGARNTACTYLSNTLGEKVLVKNLQLNANKNSKVAHANNLANAYIGRLNEMNKYGTYSKYLVGCVKLSSGLIHTQILDDWVYQCY